MKHNVKTLTRCGKTLRNRDYIYKGKYYRGKKTLRATSTKGTVLHLEMKQKLKMDVKC